MRHNGLCRGYNSRDRQDRGERKRKNLDASSHDFSFAYAGELEGSPDSDWGLIPGDAAFSDKREPVSRKFSGAFRVATVTEGVPTG
jgi:hypothetical protein